MARAMEDELHLFFGTIFEQADRTFERKFAKKFEALQNMTRADGTKIVTEVKLTAICLQLRVLKFFKIFSETFQVG